MIWLPERHARLRTNRTRASRLRLLRRAAAAGLLVLTFGAFAAAEEPTYETPNQCPNPGGQGLACANESDCAGETFATACIEHVIGDPSSRTCEIPCETGEGVGTAIERSDCAVGETCVEGKFTPGRRGFYCKPSSFHVDLNLLDQCVVQYLSGLQPAFSENLCSLDANLNALLDQTGDKVYDIFDLDLCILAFLERPACDLDSQSCQLASMTFCEDDDDCGSGLYCDAGSHACQRDCGVVASREPDIAAFGRECSGPLKTCDLSRGRCESIDVTKLTCQADSECPAGSYCQLGLCAPNCYRQVDCPDSGWLCTTNNKCRAAPPPDADAGFVFEPELYATRFTRDSLNLDSVQNSDSSGLAIMDLLTKRQVLDNPAVTFGYRLEIDYGIKQDLGCLESVSVVCEDTTDFSKFAWASDQSSCEAKQKDCIISEDEEWIRLQSPFGTVSARGKPRLAVDLEPAIADRLTPGRYGADLRIILDNGDSDTIPITFTKLSPGGEYGGDLVVYVQGTENSLTGLRPLTLSMRLEVSDEDGQWNELMEDYGLGKTSPLVDVTRGKVVHGKLHGNASLAFTRGGVTPGSKNEIPFVGLYSPDSQRIRIVGMIDIPADFCMHEDGTECTDFMRENPELAEGLLVRNLFGRRITRQIDMMGPFDETNGRFSGIYRETISGLTPEGSFTLEGNYVLDQSLADASVSGTAGLWPASTIPAMFPSSSTVSTALGKVESENCAVTAAGAAGVAASANFVSESKFHDYLAQARWRSFSTEDSAFGRTTIFPNLIDFSSGIDAALQGIQGDSESLNSGYLSIYDFLDDRIEECDGSEQAACVSEQAVTCALALHEKALLNGWIDVDQVKATHRAVLFCRDEIEATGCEKDATRRPELFALQELTRFWSSAASLEKFEGDRARSDAFLVLFRNQTNPFAKGAALAYKNDRLRAAVHRYDTATESIISPVASAMLFKFPADGFMQRGNDWLEIMKTLAADRMDAIAEFVDLKRRVFINTVAGNTMFAQHMMQQEYLLHLFIMKLQEKWQGAEFRYAGEAGAAFERGQRIVAQLNPNKNRLGITPRRVFFENPDINVTNWENYKNVLSGSDGEGGLLATAHGLVESAWEHLVNSLLDLDALEESLSEEKLLLKRELNDVCGDSAPWEPDATGVDARSCQALLKKYHNFKDWTDMAACMEGVGKKDDEGNSLCADVAYSCSEQASAYKNPTGEGFGSGNHDRSDCDATVIDFNKYICWANGMTWDSGTSTCSGASGDTPNNPHGPPTCSLDDAAKAKWLNVPGVGAAPCVGGRMRKLLQEREALEKERLLILDDFQALTWDLNVLITNHQAIWAKKKEWRELNRTLSLTIQAIKLAQKRLNSALNDRKAEAKQSACLAIAGTTAGTDCPPKAITVAIMATISNVQAVIDTSLSVALAVKERIMDELGKDLDKDLAWLEFAASLDQYSWQWMPMVRKFENLSQQIFNVGLEIDDLRYQAQSVVDHYQSRVAFVADHLVGRETGNTLVGNFRANEARKAFLVILETAYKMAMAFAHEYNLSTGDRDALLNEAMTLTTLEDVDFFVRKLETRKRDYCGFEGLDCDTTNNVSVIRVSLRDLLFPNLRDKVDGRTGTVVTKGQQFHNTITQSPFLRRRVRGVYTVDQIEIPFGLVYDALQNTVDGKPRYLLDPLTCNHVLDGRRPGAPGFAPTGNIAMNVLGSNLGDGTSQLSYELIRGPSDAIKSCHLESVTKEAGTLPVTEYPIRQHIIGYAPQSTEAQADAPASYVTRSTPFPACFNRIGQPSAIGEDECWRFFARDRSLASLDWKLVVPVLVDGAATDNTWILGEGLPADERPVLDDLVMYFRYRSRPIDE